MIIREIKPEDNAVVAAMIRKVFEEFDAPRKGTVYSDPLTDRLAETFNNDTSILWVAEDNNEIQGTCGLYPTKGLPTSCAELVKFYLPSTSRGKGTGKLLFEKTMTSARELGYGLIYIESLPQFSKAISIYKKLGFTFLEAPLGNSGHTSCTIWMIKDLNT